LSLRRWGASVEGLTPAALAGDIGKQRGARSIKGGAPPSAARSSAAALDETEAILPPEFSASRRGFLGWFLGTSVGALLLSVLYPVLRFLSPPNIPEATTNQVEAGSTRDPELIEKGYKIVRFGAEPVLLVRVSETEYRAFAATCTHLDCIVEYQARERRIWCNCHNGEYDLNGRNVGGPPPRPLERYEVHVVAKGDAPASLIVSRG
jgi:Rieske Fe-S protein